MKKTKRFLSFALAVLLIASSLPLAIIAKTLTSTEVALGGGSDKFVVDPMNELLLEIDNLADTTNAANETYTYTTEGAIIQNETERPEGDVVVTDYNGNGQWQTFIGHTNLPLTAESKYTIAFDGKMIAEFNYGGFVFTAPGAIGDQSEYRTTQGIYFGYGEKQAYLATGMNWWEEVSADRQAPIGDIDVKDEHSYMITIDGFKVGLYIDGDAISTMELPADYWGLGTYISLGVRSRADTTGAGSKVAEMKDIKVYAGGVAYSSAKYVADPESNLLLDIDNLADTTNAANETYTYTTEGAIIQNETERPEGDVVVTDYNGNGQWQTFIGHTNLPLTAESKYTITFDGKMIAAFNYGGFIFTAPGAIGDQSEYRTTQGIYFGYGEKQAYLATGMNWWEEVSADRQAPIGGVDVTAEHSYIITIDGFKVGFFIDGTPISVMELPADYWGLGTYISLGVRSRADTTGAGSKVAEMKNIKVYDGGVAVYSTHFKADPESNLLLDIDNLADTTNAANETYTYTTEGAIIQNETERPEGDVVVTDYNGNGQWQTFIGHTNLPLTAESKYTITFDGKMIAAFNYGGFIFTAPGAIGDQSEYRTTQGIYFGYGEKQAYLATGMNWWEEVSADRQASIGDVDVKAEHSYMITIDGFKVGLYIDGAPISVMELPADYWGLGTYISLGVRSRADTTGAGSKVAEMKNIKVYDGGVVPAPKKGTELLLEIDNLADTTNAANDSYTYTTAGAQIQYDKEFVDGDTVRVSEGLGNGQWATFVGHTNIPLTATSTYVITFDGKMIADFNYGGFVFSAPGAVNDKTQANTTQSIYFGYGEKQAYLSTGMHWWEEEPAERQASIGNIDVKAEHSYIIAIKGLNVYLCIDGNYVGTFPLPENYDGLGGYLSLGVRSRCNTGEANQAVAEMKNIKVYSGELELKVVNNYKDGDVLVKVPTVMKPDGWTSDFEDVTVTQSVRYQNAASGEIANALYPDASSSEYADGSEWLWAGLKTNLPLNEDSQYTVDFYMKKNQTANVGFCVTGLHWRESQGVYFYNNSFTTVAEYDSNYYTDGISFSNIWTNYCDNDGFTRFTIEVNGYEWKVYIGGVYAGTIDINGSGSKKPGSTYFDNSLSLALKVYSDATAEWDLTQPVVFLKDITVYGGNVATNKNVQFVKDGKVVLHTYAEAGDVITEFPEIEVADHETVVWFYKNTNVVATAPFTVYGDATLEARVFAKSNINIVGAQNTVAADNKQSIRFLATLQSLEGSSAGFEVVAKYLEGGVVKEKSWKLDTNKVYSAIKVTENGTDTIVTAAELGGTYLCALSVDNVPTNIGQIDFYVKSYVVMNGEKVYSQEVTFTFENGAANSELAPLN